MGFFSWKTMNTNESISNKYSKRKTFSVVLVDNNNNKWLEKDYDGYGVFGGKDYYELLAEMNIDEKQLNSINNVDRRNVGIDLEFKSKQEFESRYGFYTNTGSVLFPNLYRKGRKSIEAFEWKNEKPVSCPWQG